MQLNNATSLELRIDKACKRCETEFQPTQLATEVACCLSEGSEALQRHRLMIIALRDALESLLSSCSPAPHNSSGPESINAARFALRRSQEYYFP